MEFAIVIVALIGFLAFRMWLKHQRRVMIHRERLIAIEKGVDLPPLEQEVRQSNWIIQRILLLSGLVWISLGIGAYAVLNALLAHPEGLTDLREGIQWICIAPLMIGVSHLLVYLTGKRKEKEQK
jgi:hypothetical protein